MLTRISAFSLSRIFLIIILSIFPRPLSAEHFESLLDELAESSSSESDKDLASPPLSPEDDLAPEKNIPTTGVILQGLEKPTGRVFIVEAAVKQPVEFGTLKIIVHHCETTPLDKRQESIAFVTITETSSSEPIRSLFSGWMFSSSPALSSLDHPMYDVWIKDCKDVK